MKQITMITADMITIKNHIKTGVLSFGFLFLVSCVTDSRLTARQIVERSCEAHGGIDKWLLIKSVSFDKSTLLLKEDGSVESDLNQHLTITYKPRFTIDIRSIDDAKSNLEYEDGVVRKHIDGQLVEDQEELDRALSSLMAAEYVMKQPFALLDDNVELILLGEKDIEGRSYYEIAIGYPDDQADSDKWYYYFDKEDFTLTYNKVELRDHSSWVETLSFDESTDFKFYSRRKSYRLNQKGEKTFLRAEYFYRNFSIEY